MLFVVRWWRNVILSIIYLMLNTALQQNVKALIKRPNIQSVFGNSSGNISQKDSRLFFISLGFQIYYNLWRPLRGKTVVMASHFISPCTRFSIAIAVNCRLSPKLNYPLYGKNIFPAYVWERESPPPLFNHREQHFFFRFFVFVLHTTNKSIQQNGMNRILRKRIW